MTDSADDKNNITTTKALVFHGPYKLTPEDRPWPNPRHDPRYSALILYPDGVPDADIVEMNIPAGIPLVYELDVDMKPIRHCYPGDTERVRKAMQAGANHLPLKNQKETRL